MAQSACSSKSSEVQTSFTYTWRPSSEFRQTTHITESGCYTFGRSPAGFHNADGPDGHRVEHNHQEREFGRISTQPHGPVKVIMVQHPSTLDIACSLALVREEALASGRWRCGASSNHRSLLPHYAFQSGPPKWGQPPDSHKTSSAEDKLDVLRRFRRARGLCEKCAEKWNHGHKCIAAVHLHALEEVWELLVTDQHETESQI